MAVEHELVDALAGTLGALVLLFADHGQVPTDPSAASTSTSAARSSCRSCGADDGRPCSGGLGARSLPARARGCARRRARPARGVVRGRRVGGPDGAARGRGLVRAPHLAALPRARRRHRRATAPGVEGLVARARPLPSRKSAATTAGWSRRKPRPGSAHSSRDGARCCAAGSAPWCSRARSPWSASDRTAESAARSPASLAGGVPTWLVNQPALRCSAKRVRSTR